MMMHCNVELGHLILTSLIVVTCYSIKYMMIGMIIPSFDQQSVSFLQAL
uniref:Uncharacterized protein n=1 Tax=Rhizophora mucronata TaxID=61149 RepID=A0A2P2NRH5_RHIMU